MYNEINSAIQTLADDDQGYLVYKDKDTITANFSINGTKVLVKVEAPIKIHIKSKYITTIVHSVDALVSTLLKIKLQDGEPQSTKTKREPLDYELESVQLDNGGYEIWQKSTIGSGILDLDPTEPSNELLGTVDSLGDWEIKYGDGYAGTIQDIRSRDVTGRTAKLNDIDAARLAVEDGLLDLLATDDGATEWSSVQAITDMSLAVRSVEKYGLRINLMYENEELVGIAQWNGRWLVMLPGNDYTWVHGIAPSVRHQYGGLLWLNNLEVATRAALTQLAVRALVD